MCVREIGLTTVVDADDRYPTYVVGEIVELDAASDETDGQDGTTDGREG